MRRGWEIHRVGVTVAVLLALSMAGASARAQAELDRGRMAYLEADFEGALAAFDAALDSAQLDPAGALEAYRFLAALSLVSGDEAAAMRHARAAVALDPAATAPDGAPTELEGILAQARAEQGPEAAAIAIDRGGRSSHVTARLEHAPPDLGARLTLRCGDDDAVEGAPPVVETRVRARRGVHCTARLENTAGGTLVAAEVDVTVATRSDDGTPRDGASRRRLWPWIVGVGGGLVLAGVITAVAVVAARPDAALLETPQVEGW
jgi:hypothetical protein